MLHRLTLLAVLAVGAVWVAIVLVLAVLGTGSGPAPWGPGQSRPFNLSASFPTGDAYYNGQLDCGRNVTENVTFPAPGAMNYTLSQNESDASVNVWFVVSGVYVFDSTGVGETYGSIGYGSGYVLGSGDATFHLGFVACGPTSTVTLGFWGTITYPS